jgi:hypothetical protein
MNERAAFFSEMKQKKSKWPTQKKLIFQLCQFSIYFHGLVRGLIKLVDAKDIGLAQIIWL